MTSSCDFKTILFEDAVRQKKKKTRAIITETLVALSDSAIPGPCLLAIATTHYPNENLFQIKFLREIIQDF